MEILKKIYGTFVKPSLKFTIFIIEDDKFYASVLEKFLTDNLFIKVEISNFPVSELAVDNLHLKPNVVLLDYYLGSKFFDAANGPENVDSIKKACPDALIILITSLNLPEKEVKTYLNKGMEYIHKDELALEKIANSINKKILLKQNNEKKQLI
jgi:DNA-binding NtrC family response regulator